MDVSDVAELYISVLDSLPQQIAVIDAEGLIQWVNRSWRVFSEENGGPPDKIWRGTNYLNVCHHTERGIDQDCGDVLAGMEKVIKGEQSIFYFEYPCHSPAEQRWFMMRIGPLDFNEPSFFVVTHENITERKLLEIRGEELSRTA
jgi:PAS domain-containing protein